MGRKTTAGLTKVRGVWHIDKRIRGYGRLCESTGESERARAEQYLARRVEEIRKASIYGVRPERTWRQAATHYLETVKKKSLHCDANDLAKLDPFIGDLPLREVHMGTLRPFIQAEYAKGNAVSTVNRALAVARRILRLASMMWRDEFGLTWLETPPMIVLESGRPAKKPYPLTWEEQDRLLAELPAHLREMAIFKVNTGTREQEVCGLKWKWEVSVPELNTSVFIVPGERVKNAEDRLIVLNSTAMAAVNRQRGNGSEYVFTYRGNRVARMMNSAWKRARAAAGIPARVHDLKHTFGRRLRAAGVHRETRKVLLGHRDGDITTHYSAPEIEELLEAAERVSGPNSRKTPELVILRSA